MKYYIVRIYSPDQNKPSKIIKRGLTLKEAQEWCRRDDTHKAGKWFDGYNREGK